MCIHIPPKIFNRFRYFFESMWCTEMHMKHMMLIEWHEHLIGLIQSYRSFSIVATEWCWPNITLHVSAQNAITFFIGIFFSVKLATILSDIVTALPSDISNKSINTEWTSCLVSSNKLPIMASWLFVETSVVSSIIMENLVSLRIWTVFFKNWNRRSCLIIFVVFCFPIVVMAKVLSFGQMLFITARRSSASA